MWCDAPSVVLNKLTSFYQSVHASDYHPQLAVGVTDGSCITTNTLRATRRGGSVVCISVSFLGTLLTIYLIAIPHAQNLPTRLQPKDRPVQDAGAYSSQGHAVCYVYRHPILTIATGNRQGERAQSRQVS